MNIYRTLKAWREKRKLCKTATKVLQDTLEDPKAKKALKRFYFLNTINFDLKELYLKKGNHNEVPK